MRVSRLEVNLRRSAAERPPTLDEAFGAYLSADQKPTLILWLKAALDAIHRRQAIIRSAFDAAVDTNLRRLRGRVRNSKGAIDTDMIQAALGRTSTHQRIWGISGQVPLGVGLRCPPSQVAGMIGNCVASSPPKPLRGSREGTVKSTFGLSLIHI